MEDKGKKPNHQTNTHMKELFQVRQTGGLQQDTRAKAQKGLITTRLISQLLCLHGNYCQPSLAFRSAQAPISLRGARRAQALNKVGNTRRTIAGKLRHAMHHPPKPTKVMSTSGHDDTLKRTCFLQAVAEMSD